jgi:hypothetical protein
MKVGGAGGREKGFENRNLYIPAVLSFRGWSTMGELKDRIIRLIEQDAARKVSDLSGQYVRAKPEEKEAIQAGIDIERWVAESCQECLGQWHYLFQSLLLFSQVSD